MTYRTGPRQLSTPTTSTTTTAISTTTLTVGNTVSTPNSMTMNCLAPLNKLEGHANYKLIRSSSIDFDDAEVSKGLNSPSAHSSTRTQKTQHQQSSLQSSLQSLPPPQIVVGQMTNVRRITLLERLQEDEAAPLVFNTPK